MCPTEHFVWNAQHSKLDGANISNVLFHIKLLTLQGWVPWHQNPLAEAK